MSDALKLGRLFTARPRPPRALFSQAGRAGPRRILLIAAVGASAAVLALALTFAGHHAPVASRDARMKPVDPLPGGLHSSPEQDALAYRANLAQAQAAAQRGASYTPPIAPSVPVLTAPPRSEQAVPAPYAPPRPRFVGKPPPIYAPPPVIPAPPQPTITPAVATAPPPRVVTVADQQNDQQQQQFNAAVKDLFNQWGGRAPRTDVVLPPGQGDAAGADAPATQGRDARRSAAEPVQPVSQRAAETGRVLVPAGRGIYAHPILALSSDQSSPVVFQADSGPIAGDRMIGSFSRQNNRLVIRISSVIHNGEQIGADGVVTAPETMEAGVASGVDQHYLERFALPAAAAFVEGLGAALATTSNTAAVLSPFGGATTTTHLNIDQQLGVAAGAAAAQVGSTLNQAAPRGATISLDANVAVGVMFLTNVVAHDRR